MKPQTVGFWQGRLPHWEVEDGKYFLTIHLRGAIPQSGHARIQEIARQLRHADPKQEDSILKIQRRIFAEMEAWLDRAAPSALLRQPEVAATVMEAIKHRQENHVWNMFEYVVMPTHLHLFFETGDGHIKQVMEQFKRWTGHQAGQLVNLAGDRFWQVEWFDHWTRSDGESEKIIRYIRQNPVKAGLVRHFTQWPYASWSRSK